MIIRTKEKHVRSLATKLNTRSDEGEKKIIEGYFALFNSPTELWSGAHEEIAPGAFDSSLGDDVRALQDHDTRYVLGRTKSKTLELRTDEKGLYGVIEINENDTDAVNLYERVKRGDVDNCSFGFRVIKEDAEYRDDGTVKWTLRDVELGEISVVTFPAYEGTSVQARKKEVKQHEQRKLDLRKKSLRERLKQ